jgi:hypothetical protein
MLLYSTSVVVEWYEVDFRSSADVGRQSLRLEWIYQGSNSGMSDSLPTFTTMELDDAQCEGYLLQSLIHFVDRDATSTQDQPQ